MLAKIKTLLKDGNTAFLLSNNENEVAGKNLRYVSGFTGTSGFALIGKDFAYFISDSRYTLQIKEQVLGFDPRETEASDSLVRDVKGFEYIERTGSVTSILNDLVKKHEIKTINFDPKMQYSEFQVYQKGIENVELLPMDREIESLREVKSDDEIIIMKEAALIADKAFDYILTYIKPGVTEKEVSVELEKQMQLLGASKASFDIIVASGTRSALPHGVATDKVIEDGDIITLDFGCYYKGYASDITRTIVVGNLSEKLEEIYYVVKEAQRLGVEAVKAGVTGKEVDAACRDYITSKGYGEYFKHGTGHGLGLDVHESPSASPLNVNPLVSGNVITVEPGIYIEGVGGVRIEDDVVVTDDGCIILNESSKELISI
jgi:Xaa-Pro aminopeptidase